eukprot:CAMPEP_0182446048 /NCGR_PEP_ID=MMETSP1172-20130603/3948_1 /TAXON_ID=708627 /ORGANISM="Timspurckia oligopyrenoides, Strain CCMP3278" /LENGTH=277 /DNA_ID=CAMNT_0024641913 /DNA_START=310 /DNA_END=1143 /DNA_ORIENTATION=+
MGVDMILSHRAAKGNLHNSDALIPVIYGVLMSRIVESEKSVSLSRLTSEFHGLEPPRVSLHDYLQRIDRYSFCSRSCHILALYFVDRLSKRSSCFRITALNVHRLYITAFLLAVKSSEDVLYDNLHFSKVGGIYLRELNLMELKMLQELNYELFVSPDSYREFERSILDEVVKSSDYSCIEPQLLLTQSGFHSVNREPYFSSSTIPVDNQWTMPTQQQPLPIGHNFPISQAPHVAAGVIHPASMNAAIGSYYSMPIYFQSAPHYSSAVPVMRSNMIP